MVFYFDNFSGGYSTDLPPERMEPAMLSTAENIRWRNSLKKRKGKQLLFTSDSATGDFTGITRARLNSTWYTIAARETPTGDYRFFYGENTDTALAELDPTFDWSAGDTEFAVFGSFVVAVNGTNKPAIIYYDGGFVVETLEAYDTRTRTDSDWYAGQYLPAASAPYVDGTALAQVATVDFQISSGATGDGFYVAGALSFNKVVLNDVQPMGTVDASYSFYAGDSTWATCDMVTAPTWPVASTADVTLEFNYPQTWEVYDGTEDEINSRLPIRVAFTTPPSASVDCGLLQVYHTQYLTQIMEGDIPDQAEVHLNRLYLSSGSTVNYSPPERLTGWNEYDVEVFQKGGESILAMRSIGQYLAIIKSSAIYGYFGNVWENREVRLLSTTGTTRGRTCAVVNDILFYVAPDGIRALQGLDTFILSKHIQTDIDSFTKTDACAISYDGEYWVGFPTNDRVLIFDPDTLRSDDAGDKRVSFYKFTNMNPSQMVWDNDSTDDGYLLAIEGPDIVRYNSANYYDIDASGTADVTVTAKTNSPSFKESLTEKRYTRAKLETNLCGAFTFNIYGEYDSVTHSVTGTSGTGTGHYKTEYAVPYTIDGVNVSLEYVNTGSIDVVIYGFALEVFGRKY